MTKRTPQLETAILNGFAGGFSLYAMCRKHDVSRSAFLRWKAANPDLARRYEEAQLLHAESLVDECIELADDINRVESSAEMARYTRLQIDTRLKVARLYFKRHEEAAERRTREEERRQAELASATDETPAEPGKDRPTPPAPLHFPAPVPAEPLRFAPAVAAEPEPQCRYAGARR